MIDLLKRAMRKMTLLEVTSKELTEAELDKLRAQTALEFAESIVAYNSARIKRLKAFIKLQATEETT